MFSNLWQKLNTVLTPVKPVIDIIVNSQKEELPRMTIFELRKKRIARRNEIRKLRLDKKHITNITIITPYVCKCNHCKSKFTTYMTNCNNCGSNDLKVLTIT
jgi:hypothetical protein